MTKNRELSKITVDLYSFDGGAFGHLMGTRKITVNYGDDVITFNCLGDLERVSNQLMEIRRGLGQLVKELNSEATTRFLKTGRG